MKKNVLLSFCLLCTYGISACSITKDEYSSTDYYAVEEEAVIDATVKPNDKCGVDGISCNDTALINYTKTEADYRAYGERVKRDHLYTQAGAGNNLTATIRPGIEDDVVTEYASVDEYGYEQPQIISDTLQSQGDWINNANPSDSNSNVSDEPIIDDGAFTKTAANDFAPQVPTQDNGQIGRSNNIVDTIKGPGYEIICEEECDEFANLDDNSDVITSEFTEESFDIADYDKDYNENDENLDTSGSDDDDDIHFTEIGEKTMVAENIDIKEVKVADDSILTWDAKEGDNVRELLTKWSAQAGWKLLWNTNRNYVLSAGVMFKGKFTDVSSALIRAFARARPAPIATFYKGNRVIVVETMENENAY